MPEWLYDGPHGDTNLRLAYLTSLDSGYLAVDIETVSLEDDTPLAISFSPSADEAFFLIDEDG